MFQTWLNENRISDYSFSTRLFPPASDRAFWEKHLGEKQIRAAEGLLGYEWPLIRATQFMEFQKSGNRMAQENPHFDRRYALLSLFLGELAEGKGRFLPDLLDGIFLICEETFWGLSAHNITARKKDLIHRADDPYIDLFAAETAELLVVIYHILYDELKAFCPLILDRIEYELDRRIMTPYLTHFDFFWMGYRGTTVNNWMPWIESNILTVTLLCPARQTKIEAAIRKMLTEMQKYYESIPEDGGCDEGSHYWTKAGAKLFEFCDLFYRATDGKINFFTNAKLREIALYEARAWIDGTRFVNFADGTGSSGKALLDYPLYGYGERLGEPSLCRLAKTLKENRKEPTTSRLVPRGCSIKAALFSFLYAEKIDAQPPFEPEKKVFLPDLQNAFLREGDWFLAAKGGHNKENHNHNDVGSFLLSYGGEPILLDPGCGTYTRQTFGPERYTIWTMQSAWHNLPAFNGIQEKNGAEFAADGFSLEENAIRISFGGAYPEEAGFGKAERSLILEKDGLLLEDRFTFKNEKNSFREHFITLYKPEKAEGGILLGGKILLETNLSWESEFRSFEGDEKLIDAWNADGLWRIGLKSECGKEANIQIKIRSRK